MFDNLIRKNYDAADSAMWQGVGQGALGGATAGMTFGPWGAAIGGLVGGGLSLWQGENQKKKAHDLLNNTKYPIYQIPKAEQDNLQIAKAQANQGLPSQQYNNAAKDIQRAQVSSLLNAKDRRGGLAAIAPVQQNATDAYGKLNAQDAATRLQNQRQLLGVNNTFAGYEDKAFNWNQRNKYQQDYNYGMTLLGAGNQNVVGGIDKIGGALALFAGSGGFRKKKTTPGDPNDPTTHANWATIDTTPVSQGSFSSPAAGFGGIPTDSISANTYGE